MSLSQFLLILRARRLLVFLIFFSILVSVVVASLAWPPTYKAAATVVLNPGVDPVTGNALPGQLVPSYIATQVSVIHSRELARQVAEDLQLGRQPENIRKFNSESGSGRNIDDWLAERLLKKLDVSPAKDSNVIEIGFADRDASASAAIANAFALHYQKQNTLMRLGPARSAASYFDDQIKRQRATLDQSRARLTKVQKESGITDLDSHEGVDAVRLNELATQLVAVENQLIEARSKQAQADGGNSTGSQDIQGNETVRSQRIALEQAEERLAEVSQLFLPGHPRYEQAKAAVIKRRAALRESARDAGTGLSRNTAALEQRRTELASALAAQKQHVLETAQARDELTTLSKEVANQQQAYDTLMQRRAQSGVEAQSRQSEVTILSPAIAPFKAAYPKLSLNIAIGLLAGMLLGIGAALFSEIQDRRIRSYVDILDVLDAPVLGSVTWERPKPVPIGMNRWARSRPALPT